MFNFHAKLLECIPYTSQGKVNKLIFFSYAYCTIFTLNKRYKTTNYLLNDQ